MSITRKLWVGSWAPILAIAVAGSLIAGGAPGAGRAIEYITAFDGPAATAAHEAGIDALAVGRGVLGYAETGDQGHDDRGAGVSETFFARIAPPVEGTFAPSDAIEEVEEGSSRLRAEMGEPLSGEARSVSGEEDARKVVGRVPGAVVAVALLLGLVLGGSTAPIGRRLTRSVRRLREGPGKTGRGETDSGVEVPVKDEPGAAAPASGDEPDRRRRADAELRESEERFRSLTEATFEAVAIVERGKILEVNPAFAAMFGYEPPEIVGRSALEAVAPESVELVRDSISSGSEEPYQAVGLRKDGARFDMEIRGRASVYRGRPVRVTSIRDVTERKRAEEALRRSERGLAAAQRVAHVGNWEFDVRRGELRWSDELYRIYGFAPQEFVPTYNTFVGSVHPDDRERLLKTNEEVLREGKHPRVECRVVRPDGEVRVVQNLYEVDLDERGGAVRIAGTVLDITERKKAEEKIREAGAGYRTLVEQIPAVTYIDALDEAGSTLYMSPQIEAMLGYSPEEWIATPGFWRKALHPEDRERVLTENARADETLEPFGLEYRLIARDGRSVWVLDEATVVRDETNNPLYWQGFLFDITERKRAERALREAEERYRSLVEHIPAVIYIDGVDETNSAIYRSPFVERMLGYPPEEFLSDPEFWQNLLHPDDRERVLAENERTNRTGEPFRIEYRMIHKDGRAVWVRDEAVLIRDGEGRPKFWQGVFMDVTERKEAEASREEAEARYRTLVEQIPAVTYIQEIRHDDAVLYISPQVEALTGYPPEAFYSDPGLWYGTVHPDDRERVIAEDRRTEETGEPFAVEYRMIHRDGRVRWVRDEAVLVADPAGRPRLWQGVMSDITERKQLEDKLSYQAFHDSLTGLPNRALFLDRLSHALDRAERRGDSVGVLFVDLDNFKVVNDSLGHDCGDRMLIAVADMLRDTTRPADTVARLGGDEFTILIEDVAGAGEVTGVAERIAEKLGTSFVLGDQEVSVTPSIGIAFGGPGRERPEDLLRDADIAMYRAKRMGKAQYRVFDPGVDARETERLRLESALRRAIEHEEFVVFYQPKILVGTGEIAGMEALVRWAHPDRGLVSPAEFVPLAEETGLIVPLGRWVLDEACRQARRWHELYPADPPLTMNVNLSAKQFNRPGLVESVAKILRETALEPRSLVLEITESVMMEDVRAAMGTLRRLKDLGVGIAIDDFGTGYSSLSYLKRFPVDFLKIDRSFVEGLENPEDEVLVSGIIDLAHALGLGVVAEGVETAGQLARLREMGCELAQGFYFWKPLPGEDMNALLETRATANGAHRPAVELGGRASRRGAGG